MNFDQFVTSEYGNSWISEPGIKIYIRRTYPNHKRVLGDFQLANLEARRPGKGALTAFLDRYEPHYQFFVENILEPRLIPYLTRRGYTLDIRERGGGPINHY